MLIKRTGAMAIALTLLTCLGSTPSRAGTFIVSLQTPGVAVSGLDVQFTGLVQPLSNVSNFSFVGLPSGVSETVIPIPIANGIAFAFVNGSTVGLPASVTKFTFSFTSGNSTMPAVGSASWYNGTSLQNNPPGITGVVPEPASVALLGIGMIGFLSCRRLSRRKAC